MKFACVVFGYLDSGFKMESGIVKAEVCDRLAAVGGTAAESSEESRENLEFTWNLNQQTRNTGLVVALSS